MSDANNTVVTSTSNEDPPNPFEAYRPRGSSFPPAKGPTPTTNGKTGQVAQSTTKKQVSPGQSTTRKQVSPGQSTTNKQVQSSTSTKGNQSSQAYSKKTQ
ncbi:hypothetical protein BV25DRAFT_1918282 [Artomyces pyxidatus]|uniref:Uncharacterized protein n=1 Tax=Artomyces pyxidatus TaxID=48021 RepID=A0ACB8STJ4_9AGAM|nr:hypothetical protein BV25DRAFT_1918282 [Artomyces pyxidatus]